MIIGICGFQSSGKDTVGDLLVNKYCFKKLSFASIIKDILSIMFGWSRDKLEGSTKEDREWRETVDTWWANKLNMPQLSPRYVMRYFGTDLFRNHWHPDIWVKVVECQMSKYENIVITDCRFENEINMIKQYGGKLIHIYRELPHWFNDYKTGKDSIESSQLHPSEISWIRHPFDYEIHNNSTLMDLSNKISDIMFRCYNHF
jgi:hypothetical protein